MAHRAGKGGLAEGGLAEVVAACECASPGVGGAGGGGHLETTRTSHLTAWPQLALLSVAVSPRLRPRPCSLQGPALDLGALEWSHLLGWKTGACPPPWMGLCRMPPGPRRDGNWPQRREKLGNNFILYRDYEEEKTSENSPSPEGKSNFLLKYGFLILKRCNLKRSWWLWMGGGPGPPKAPGRD